MNASGMKWISHAQKNPFVSNMLLPKNQPRKLAKSTPSDPNWNPVADINNDQLVDIFDITIIALTFGETG
jgi:hypothetical protein